MQIMSNSSGYKFVKLDNFVYRMRFWENEGFIISAGEGL